MAGNATDCPLPHGMCKRPALKKARMSSPPPTVGEPRSCHTSAVMTITAAMASCTHHVKTRIAHATVALKPRSSAQLHQLAVWEWNHRVVQGLAQTNDTHVQPGSPHIRCTPYVLLQALRCAHRCLSLAWPDAACKKLARALIAATCHAHPNSRTMHIAPHHCRWAHLQRTRKHKRETKGSFKCQANAHRTSSVLAPFATSLGFLRHRAVFGEMTLALRHITIAHARSLTTLPADPPCS